MQIIYINTQNIIVAKDMFIRFAIKSAMQYVEMENEVIIEYNYLFRFIEEKEVSFVDLDLITILNNSDNFKEYSFIVDENIISFNKKDDFPKIRKNDYKIESRKVKNKVKTKINYNRRK